MQVVHGAARGHTYSCGIDKISLEWGTQSRYAEGYALIRAEDIHY